MTQNWKRVEDRICQALGGRRVLGNRGSGIPDGDERVPFAVEVKAGYERPRLSSAWLEQAQRNAKRDGRPWLIVQAPKHSRRPIATLDFYVLAEICQKAGLIGVIEVGEEEAERKLDYLAARIDGYTKAYGSGLARVEIAVEDADVSG